MKKERLGLGLIGLTWLVFFARILSGRYIYWLDDLKILYYPLEVAYSNFQHAWQLPLWSPLFGMGQPLLAWGQLGFFTPLHVLLRALYVNPINLLQISVAGYFALGLVGFYLLLRQHGLWTWAAAVGAVVYTFSGFNIGHLNHVNFYVGTMVLPLLLISVKVFVRQPTLPRAGTTALLASVIAISAQPQIVLFIFCLAALYGLVLVAGSIQKTSIRTLWPIIGYTTLAAAMAFLLSSLAILPLAEFIPETERAADLPVEELLDFSYPPSHAITLIAPYFFGDHSSYWGAKGFQELAAFTGILPLLLSGIAITRWQKFRELRLVGLLLIFIGVIMALGRYSPLYSYLVTNHILTTLNIPGRFVFFFTTGIALLTAVGAQDIITYESPRRRRLIEFCIPPVVLSLILIPFAFLLAEPRVAAHTREVLTNLDTAVVLAVAGILLYYVAWWLLPRTDQKKAVGVVVGVAVVGTLVILGFNYTPTTLRANFTNSLVFADHLSAYAGATGLPGRLYSREVLLNDVPRHKVVATEPISPHYTVWQPVTVTIPTNPCFIIPMQSATAEGEIEVSLVSSLTGQALDNVTIQAHKTLLNPDQRICFKATLPASPTESFLRFSSQSATTIRLGIYPVPNPSAYLVRVANPSPDTIAASQKPHRIDLSEDLSGQYDDETFLLARHIQVVGQASSARWIGALSNKPFREFIEEFLANDADTPFTGDGKHIIEQNRAILDMLGITHLAQQLPPGSFDTMPEANYNVVAQAQAGANTYRLYANPQAFPKAWLVPKATFISAADETIYALNESNFDPKQQIYVSGPKPPTPLELATEPAPLDESPGVVHLTKYEPTNIILTVTSPRDTWLILSDTTSPQWHTSIDGAPAPYYIANTFMKAAFVPAGEHTVSFVYRSPATARAKQLTYLGLFLLTACYVFPLASRFYRGSPRPQVGVPPQTS